MDKKTTLKNESEILNENLSKEEMEDMIDQLYLDKADTKKDILEHTAATEMTKAEMDNMIEQLYGDK